MGNVFQYPLEQSVPLGLHYTDNGVSKPGLDIFVQLRSVTDADKYLDFADNTWKASGWITKQVQLVDLGTGLYQYSWDSTAAITTSKIVIAEYVVTTVDFEANDSDTLMFALVSFDSDLIAQKVWRRQTSTEQEAGSFGKLVQDTHADVTTILQIETGRWKIENYQLILYQPDNVTEIARFNIFDEAGNPSENTVFDRIKV